MIWKIHLKSLLGRATIKRLRNAILEKVGFDY